MILGAQHIREATQADFGQIAHLISESHRAAGASSDHYEAWKIEARLHEVRIAKGKILVADLEGAILSCGAVAASAFARHTWTLSLGATRPDMQGRGLGHHLVVRRLEIAVGAGAGVVLVSSRNEARWRRYNFARAFTNSVTGAHLMFLPTDHGRGA